MNRSVPRVCFRVGVVNLVIVTFKFNLRQVVGYCRCGFFRFCSVDSAETATVSVDSVVSSVLSELLFEQEANEDVSISRARIKQSVFFIGFS